MFARSLFLLSKEKVQFDAGFFFVLKCKDLTQRDGKKVKNLGALVNSHLFFTDLRYDLCILILKMRRLKCLVVLMHSAVF